MIEPVYIVDVFRDIVAATAAAIQKQSDVPKAEWISLLDTLKAVDPLITDIHYDYGHYTDIRTKLTEKGKTDKQGRYPLICLFEDYRVEHGTEGLTGIANLKLIILHISKNTIDRQTRETNVFRPILYPIYFEFLRQLKASGKFQIYDETKIQHTQINRPHWGDPGLYKNDSYLFGDVLDGIEITDLQLLTYLPNCL